MLEDFESGADHLRVASVEGICWGGVTIEQGVIDSSVSGLHLR